MDRLRRVITVAGFNSTINRLNKNEVLSVGEVNCALDDRRPAAGNRLRAGMMLGTPRSINLEKTLHLGGARGAAPAQRPEAGFV